jgi:hypothetical protein
MAEKHPSSSRTAPPQQTPWPGKASIYTTPGTAQDAPKGAVGVYDRPERTFGSWSPVVIIALLLGLLVLLWALGIFKYVVG